MFSADHEEGLVSVKMDNEFLVMVAHKNFKVPAFPELGMILIPEDRDVAVLNISGSCNLTIHSVYSNESKVLPYPRTSCPIEFISMVIFPYPAGICIHEAVSSSGLVIFVINIRLTYGPPIALCDDTGVIAHSNSVLSQRSAVCGLLEDPALAYTRTFGRYSIFSQHEVSWNGT